MKRVFIIHGLDGMPNSGWKLWLLSELRKSKISASALLMPSPHDPKMKEWVSVIKNSVLVPDEETFFVGHSLGVAAILRYLETLKEGQKIGGAVLVSGPYIKIDKLNKKSFARRADSFFRTDFAFSKIKKSCKKFAIIHGDDDDVVPFNHAEVLSKKLNCQITIVHNGGHLTGHEGWTKLPQALKALEEMFK